MKEEVKEYIHKMVMNLLEEPENFPYLYNAKSFTPGKTPVYYSGPYWDEKELTAALRSFIGGKRLVSGEQVARFQNKFSHMFNVKHSHMVNSGSSANLVLIAAVKKHYKWQDGDEIIVSPVGFPTTIAPIVQAGMKPVFIDIEMNSLNFDLAKITEKISSKTKAIFLSPVLGNPPDMDVLQDICETNNIKLLLDNCDSLGSRWNGTYLNQMAAVSSCSFYPAHHITTGEGGMVSSDDEELISLVRSLAWWGRDCYCVGAQNLLAKGTCGKRFSCWLEGQDTVIDHKYLFTHMGYNLKPLDLQGAIGMEQLGKFSEIHKQRRTSKQTLGEIFKKSVPGCKVPDELPQSETSWFGTPIVCESKEQKVRLVNHLESNKIQTRNYFAGNILIHPAYRGLDDYTLYPNSNKVLDLVFFVGASPHYTEDIFNYVADVMGDFK